MIETARKGSKGGALSRVARSDLSAEDRGASTRAVGVDRLAVRLTGRLTGRLTAAVAAFAAAVAFTQVVVAPGGYGADTPSPGRTDALGPAAAGRGGAADLSADGRTAALTGPGGLAVRDLATGKTTALDTGGAAASAPSLSGTGRLLAYTATGPAGSGLRIVDRLATGGPADRPLTGGRGDLPFQRPAACLPDCGPLLSDGGRTVVFPARQAIGGSAVTTYVLDAGGRRVGLTSARSAPALLDFGADATPGRPVERTLVLALPTGSTVPLTAPRVESDGAFAIVPGSGTCAGVAGAGCEVRLRFTPDPKRCAKPTSTGTLFVASPVPGGQTAVALIGDTAAVCASRPAAAVATSAAGRCPDTGDAPGRKALLVKLRLGPEAAARGGLGQVAVGTERLYAVTVTNAPTGRGLDVVSEPRRLRFTTSDCALTLVQPETPLPGQPPPCQAGTALPPAVAVTAASWRSTRRLGDARQIEAVAALGSCTAYLRLAPGAVRPYAAALSLEAGGSLRDAVRMRLTGAGFSDVVVARRDPAGVGNFTGRGRPAARVVGAGTAPSVSADGRWIAFTGAPPAASTGPQVYLADTDSRGDRTYRSGPTTLVSTLPGGALPLRADAASLSGDGRSVAFEAVPPGADCACTQVYVADLGEQGGVVLASGTPDGAPANRESFSPALSADGSTAVFASRAGDLADVPGTRPDPERTYLIDLRLNIPGRPGMRVRPGGPPFHDENGAAIYLRDLGPDRGGPGAPGTELVSAPQPDQPAPTRAGLPAIAGDGGVVVFRADGDLTSPGREQAPVDAEQLSAWARTRTGMLAASPDGLDFGRLPLDVTGKPLPVTVTNTGSGPMHPQVTSTGPFTAGPGCTGVTLHRAESCTVEVLPAPTEQGPAVGTAVVSAPGAPELSADPVPLVAEIVAPALSVTPGALVAPPTGLGITADPLPFTVTNRSGEPLTLGVAATPASDFDVSLGDCGQVLAPGAACTPAVTFHPSKQKLRTGTAAVTGKLAGGGTALARVPVSGNTLAPALALDLPVVRAGQIVTLTGSHFPPSADVRLAPVSERHTALTVRTDEAGAFSLPIPVRQGDAPGRWSFEASSAGIAPVAGPELLLAPGTAQPNRFVSRR